MMMTQKTISIISQRGSVATHLTISPVSPDLIKNPPTWQRQTVSPPTRSQASPHLVLGQT